MDKNQELSEVHRIWKKQCYDPLKAEYEKREEEKLSCAFGFGLSEHYLNGKKKVMVIG